MHLYLSDEKIVEILMCRLFFSQIHCANFKVIVDLTQFKLVGHRIYALKDGEKS